MRHCTQRSSAVSTTWASLTKRTNDLGIPTLFSKDVEGIAYIYIKSSEMIVIAEICIHLEMRLEQLNRNDKKTHWI